MSMSRLFRYYLKPIILLCSYICTRKTLDYLNKYKNFKKRLIRPSDYRKTEQIFLSVIYYVRQTGSDV